MVIRRKIFSEADVGQCAYKLWRSMDGEVYPNYFVSEIFCHVKWKILYPPA